MSFLIRRSDDSRRVSSCLETVTMEAKLALAVSGYLQLHDISYNYHQRVNSRLEANYSSPRDPAPFVSTIVSHQRLEKKHRNTFLFVRPLRVCASSGSGTFQRKEFAGISS